jgi:valyl-tRNA synthetase
MPFLTEEIWSLLPREGEPTSLSQAGWPGPWPEPEPDDLARFTQIQEAVRSVRNLRAEANLPPRQKVNLVVIPLNQTAEAGLRSGVPYLTQLANLETVTFCTADAPRPENALSAQLPDMELYLPLEGLVDVDKERARLEKQIETAQKELERIETKLANPNFSGKAPRAVVEKEEAKRAELTETVRKLGLRVGAL